LCFSLMGESERRRTANSDDVSSTALFDLDSTTSELPDDVLDKLKAASGVWLAAEQNLTAEQMSAIFSASDLLRQTIRRGGVICASGPVGMILGRTRCDCEPNPAAFGLNLIPDTIIATDFGRETQRSRMLRVLESQPGNVGIGIDKDAAIILTGRKIRVTGQGDATFLLSATEREPVKEKRVEQAPNRRANPYKCRVDLTAWRRMAIDRTLAPFPPLKPESPRVDNGTLVIVGGGGLPSGLMNRFVELAGGHEVGAAGQQPALRHCESWSVSDPRVAPAPR
jgi:cyanophycinase